jgi:hypothetical protein
VYTTNPTNFLNKKTDQQAKSAKKHEEKCFSLQTTLMKLCMRVKLLKQLHNFIPSISYKSTIQRALKPQHISHRKLTF